MQNRLILFTLPSSKNLPTYLKYYLGYLEICKLKESAFALSPDLSLIEFHRWFLEEGPTPFSLLQKDLPDLCHENSLK